MKGDHFDNLYNKWEPNRHDEGNGHNAGLDQTASYHLNLQPYPQGGSPIGLTLKKSNSLINLVERTLSDDGQHKKLKLKHDKMKASNFPALLLQIGSWKRISRNEGDLVVKVYYAKKKIVWEFLDGPLKSKIEIQWSDISAIRSFIREGQHGRLEIELDEPPQFGKEINPQPRKHTQWKQTSDFTGGQASICRRHSVIVPPGVLDKEYEKLIQCDSRLFSLNKHPFPVTNYPFFYHDPNHSLHSSGQPHGDLDSNLTSVMALSYLNEENLERGNNHCGGSHIDVKDYLLWSRIMDSYCSTIKTENAKPRIDFPGCENGANRLLELEAEPWVGVPNIDAIPWESRMETFLEY